MINFKFLMFSFFLMSWIKQIAGLTLQHFFSGGPSLPTGEMSPLGGDGSPSVSPLKPIESLGPLIPHDIMSHD